MTKINRKDREQKRVMLITDKAVYNLLPDSYSTCKRRIGHESIVGITASTVSEEFVLHVPDEYDYRFKSVRACDRSPNSSSLIHLCVFGSTGAQGKDL